jgi:hypothetical protein
MRWPPFLPSPLTCLSGASAVVAALVLGACGGGGEQATPPAPGPDTVAVEIFLTNETLGDPCTEVYPVPRQVDADDPATGTLQALLAGPTDAEAQQGYGGWFSADTADLLLDVEVVDHTAHVTFADLRDVIPNASTSCGSSALLAQLDTTLLALDGIDDTRYAIADQTAFYEWLQLTDPDAPVPPSSPDADATAAPPLLIAGADGIRIVEQGGASRSFRMEVASLAVPDLTGGVVFQGPRHAPTDLRWDEGLGRNVHLWGEGGPDPIWRVERPGADPVAIVTHPDARLTLEDVVALDGRPTVVYRMMIGGPEPQLGSERMVEERQMLFDLTSSTTRTLGLIGAFESDFTQLRLGGELVAVTTDPYGGLLRTMVGAVPREVLDADVADDWLPTRFHGRLHHGPGVECAATDACEGWAVATAASDGTRLSWVEGTWPLGGSDRPRPLEVITVDRATGDETMRVTLGPVGPTNVRARFIDDDGTFIVVSGVGPGDTVLLVGPGGAVIPTGLDGVTASWWVE